MLTAMLNQGEVIHHTRDRLGSILVIDYRKHRVLTFNSAFEQSKIDRRRPWLPVHEYSRAMMLPAAFAHPRHVTILGLGGGVMASAFYHLYPECQIHVVELRQAVLDVSREFFALPDSPRLQVTIADARQTLSELPDASTDIIQSDLYTADRMSQAQSQRLFIDECSRVLGPEGWLTLNYHQPPNPDSPWFRRIKRHFPALLTFRSKSNNTVLYASKKPLGDLNSRDPLFTELEQRLPVGWRKIMGKVTRI